MQQFILKMTHMHAHCQFWQERDYHEIHLEECMDMERQILHY